MEALIANFWGYLKLYQSKLILVLLIGALLEILFLVLARKGYTKYEKNLYSTMISGLILSLSSACILVLTLYGRKPREDYSFRLGLFASYIEVFRLKDAELLLQILMNILVYIPVGFLLPCCFEKLEKNRNVLLIILGISFGIEMIQGIFRLGMFETDDILGNVLGAEVGFLIYLGLKRIVIHMGNDGV